MTNIDKLIYSIYILSQKSRKELYVEDIVVNAYKQFPKSFCLKGYPNFPDSGRVEKRLYDNLQPKGYIRIVNKKVQLTDFGLEYCASIDNGNSRLENANQARKTVSKDEFNNYLRLISLDGFQLFIKDEESKLIDVDIFQFYKTSVHTNIVETKGRIKITTNLIKKFKRNNFEYADKLIAYNDKIEHLYWEMLNGTD